MGSTDPQSYKAKYKYETVKGVFLQDDPKTDWNGFEYTKHNFGLIPRSYPTDSDPSQPLWERFGRYIQHLQSSAPAGTFYKLLYFGRHGEGYHNVAEAKYGTKDWDDYWSKLEGDGELFWSDAHLTDKGKEQALEAHAFIGEQLAWAKMPAPQSYYVSPMFRCLQTANLTYSGLKLPDESPFDPLIKELLREVLGEHTCDRRSTRSYIHEHFPKWRIEEGLTEQDELWKADHRETHDEHDARTTEFLDNVFSHDEKIYVSLTTHSGAIASHLRVLGHQEFRLVTGGMIPVLVKATKKE
ncbi:hypothetical protein PRZ48_004328 [Zasmidium cellare]|uniref:Phosphoglycerate mutase n=1 Tax=Zasmidium cellare TaxID=395010 RepID=A0ABR0EQN3_ZASCE|nr:hypothetical protein PRZ48_004328 [Zasmidium cellare]